MNTEGRRERVGYLTQRHDFYFQYRMRRQFPQFPVTVSRGDVHDHKRGAAILAVLYVMERRAVNGDPRSLKLKWAIEADTKRREGLLDRAKAMLDDHFHESPMTTDQVAEYHRIRGQLTPADRRALDFYARGFGTYLPPTPYPTYRQKLRAAYEAASPLGRVRLWGPYYSG